MQTTLPRREIVLLGIGHTNAHVLRMWRMKPLPQTGLTCVSNFPVATYSGMLPGVLAGQYPPPRMEIDLVRLCAASGARLVIGEVVGLNRAAGRLQFSNRPDLPFDALSIGIGSVPSTSGVAIEGDSLLPIKPMQTFLRRFESRLRAVAATTDERPRIVVVGGGVGGVEITFCLPGRVDGREPHLTLIHGGTSLPEGMLPKTSQITQNELQRRGVQLELGCRVNLIEPHQVVLDDGRQLAADIVIWATGASPPPLLGKLDLPTDDRGFLLTDDTLRTVAGDPIFAVGDTGTIRGSQTPKAGVYAVRQGPVLWKNLRRSIEGGSLERYQPQRGFLKLINTADGKAIVEYLGLSFRNGWGWKLKDAIDGRFMDKYQDYRPMEMSTAPSNGDPIAAMRCAGCGGKVGSSVLSAALERLDVPRGEHVLLGLERPDDAAVIQPPGGRPVTVTTDFFASPLDDPYLVGRIAALNAASDVFAMGAQPIAALAIATLPLGPPRAQQQLLYELLAGSLDELRRMEATLVGGHTIEGPQLTIGFTLLADQGDGQIKTKGMLRPGDVLVLTKPLGTGVLLAAQMSARCEATWMQALLDSMLLSNRLAALLMPEFDIEGVTDVTGFGLAGHLLEMLRSGKSGARLYLDQIPLLPGTAALIEGGTESTLAPANRSVEAELQVAERRRTHPAYAALFDPQTSGGLLLGVAPANVDRLLARLAEQSDVTAAAIGEVIAVSELGPRLLVE